MDKKNGKIVNEETRHTFTGTIRDIFNPQVLVRGLILNVNSPHLPNQLLVTCTRLPAVRLAFTLKQHFPKNTHKIKIENKEQKKSIQEDPPHHQAQRLQRHC
jgi:hypothetical protein